MGKLKKLVITLHIVVCKIKQPGFSKNQKNHF